MDDTFTDELHRLRARAYGPDADIHDDPAALERLQDLELRHRRPPLPPPPPDPPAAARTAGPTAPHPDLTRHRPEVPPQPSPAPALVTTAPARRWSRGRVAPVWIASLVVAGLAGAAVAAFVPRAQPAPVATLQVADDAVWPGDVLGPQPDGALLFDEHLGVQVIAVPQETQGGPTACLYAMNARELPRGAFHVACGAGPFPPTLTSLVSTEWPAETLERLPLGSAVKYVLDGDRVLVYTAPPAAAPKPTR